LASGAGLSVLVEVHDASELQRAQVINAPLIGVNNRNLKDFTVDLAVTESGRVKSMSGSYEEFSKTLPLECKTEDEIADVVEALVGVGVAVRFPTPEAFASGNKTLEVLLPGDEEAKVSVALAMGKALSSIEWLSTEPAQ